MTKSKCQRTNCAKRNLLLGNEVLVDERRHDREGDGARRLANDLEKFLVRQANNVLSVDLNNLVVDEETVPIVQEMFQIQD